MDDLREEIKQAKSDDPKGERLRELEDKLKEKELELAGEKAVLARVEKEFKEVSCSHSPSARYISP